ncbi:MAG: hypothetical protein JRJ85_04880 [Deltaproteobacteria bacterium]|nr:hypothetical protein [Deltaproteobacteria bacterium]
MFELIKKSLLASLGAAVVTKEKVEKVTRKLVDEGKISKDEAEKLSQDLLGFLNTPSACGGVTFVPSPRGEG